MIKDDVSLYRQSNPHCSLHLFSTLLSHTWFDCQLSRFTDHCGSLLRTHSTCYDCCPRGRPGLSPGPTLCHNGLPCLFDLVAACSDADAESASAALARLEQHHVVKHHVVDVEPLNALLVPASRHLVVLLPVVLQFVEHRPLLVLALLVGRGDLAAVARARHLHASSVFFLSLSLGLRVSSCGPLRIR